MTPGKYDLKLYRGDSYSWQFVLWADEGRTIPIDLAGSTAAAEFRDKAGGAVIVPFICSITAPNIVNVAMTPAMWVGAPTAGAWDLEIQEADGTVNTYLAGKVTVTADVTHSTPGGA